MHTSTLLLGAAVFGGALAALDPASVPRDSPIQGNYAGSLRPQIHFSPPSQFMNDPNGMFVDAEGIYHLYYQYNPTDVVAGNQHWGHATSKDLYHWDNQKIALFPDRAGEAIFSGSAIVDPDNTSGFFPGGQKNGVVAIYTKHTALEQVQELAYSIDGGYTFTKYQGNPVLTSNSTQFRDPKVVWHAETKKWIMVIAYAQEFVIGIFTSPDLKQWTFGSNFTSGLFGQQYECPNLVQMRMTGTADLMWVMTISINPGAPLGGSITEYFPGTFNGTKFVPFDNAARIADSGKDNYAGQFFYGTPKEQDAISIAWASNWQYSQVVPTGSESWRSVMSLPRYNYMTNSTRVGYTMVSKPFGLETIQNSQLGLDSDFVNKTILIDYSSVESGAVYFQLNVTGLPKVNLTGTANFTFSSSVSGESVSGGKFFGGDTHAWVDRGKARGFDNPFFTDKFTLSSIQRPDGGFMMEGVIDRSILEVFLDGGEQSATNTFFATSPLNTLRIATADMNPGVKVSAAVWGLDSAWAAKADANGLVRGNTTASSGSGNGTAPR
ncbi:MAG: hypothetical protein M1832_001159 [Thelocarpon impressellum]|nr:MAG: hypothetical protein M1832_001159 [Thelocarpon impressellum]